MATNTSHDRSQTKALTAEGQRLSAECVPPTPRHQPHAHCVLSAHQCAPDGGLSAIHRTSRSRAVQGDTFLRNSSAHVSEMSLSKGALRFLLSTRARTFQEVSGEVRDHPPQCPMSARPSKQPGSSTADAPWPALHDGCTDGRQCRCPVAVARRRTHVAAEQWSPLQLANRPRRARHRNTVTTG